MIVCVPTPLTDNREPDLGPLETSAQSLAHVVQAGQLMVLESTSYPGTTRELLVPVLEEHSMLSVGETLNVAFSPERIDPGRMDLHAQNTAKVIGGITEACTDRAVELYSAACATHCARLHARGGGDDEAAREHLPLGEHRARQRALDPGQSHGHRHLGGRRGRLHQALRLHAL